MIDVMIQNVGTQPPKPISMITEAIRTNVEDDEDVIIIPIVKEVVNQSQTLDHMNPPKVDKFFFGYITKGKNKRRASSNNSQPASKS